MADFERATDATPATAEKHHRFPRPADSPRHAAQLAPRPRLRDLLGEGPAGPQVVLGFRSSAVKALAFGNERLGLSAEFLAVCDGAFHIPLFGLTESLNVSVAVAVALHHARLSRASALRCGTLWS